MLCLGFYRYLIGIKNNDGTHFINALETPYNRVSSALMSTSFFHEKALIFEVS